MRRGVWECDAARHVATKAPLPSRRSYSWKRVGADPVMGLAGNCIGHVGMVLVGYYGRLIVRPDLGCRQEESLDSTLRKYCARYSRDGE